MLTNWLLENYVFNPANRGKPSEDLIPTSFKVGMGAGIVGTVLVLILLVVLIRRL